jgi:hypothetical protein
MTELKKWNKKRRRKGESSIKQRGFSKDDQ